MTKRKLTRRNLRKKAEKTSVQSPHPLAQEAIDSARLTDGCQADGITKILMYFNDGSTRNLVVQDRFLQVRDALKEQSRANEILNKQAEMLEAKIRELQAENETLRNQNQEFMQAVDAVQSIDISEHMFRNPLL